MNKNTILNNLDSGPGYLLYRLENQDYNLVKSLIIKQYKKVIINFYPKLNENEYINNIDNYHKLNISNHKSIWSKNCRTLEEEDLKIFKSSGFIKKLEKIFDNIIITNEDKTRSEEVYWRIVRPNIKEDIGPLHADSWFWDLHNGSIDESFRRIKVWISIYNEKGKNGLRVIKNSQKHKYNYKGELRDGKMKPVDDNELEQNKNIQNLLTSPGDCVIFHDDLIHGGFVGGDKTRVSIEFTFLVKK
jgi:hypothetical protein